MPFISGFVSPQHLVGIPTSSRAGFVVDGDAFLGGPGSTKWEGTILSYAIDLRRVVGDDSAVTSIDPGTSRE